jgi:EAL domain-containing protein (putative c-di-GMP-specific phosphodiesterase class I)
MEVDLSASRHALLGEIHSRLSATVDDFVERCYDELTHQPGPSEVLARLSEAEHKRLRASQAEHLLFVLHPDLDDELAYVRARQVGRVHSMVGVEIEWYAAAMSSHHQQIFDLVGTIPDTDQQAWLYSTLAHRLMWDLQAALAGYRDVDAAQHRAMMRLNQAVARAGTVPDLIGGVLSACDASDGIAAAFFGRPDSTDVFQLEMGVGPGAEEFMSEVSRREPMTITVLGDDVRGHGPSGRSWRSGAIERSDNYLIDPATAPWHALGERFGWRSSASVPIADATGEPRGLLSFYSSWPGFFAPPARQGQLLQVKHLVEHALSALEERGTVASGVRAYSARTSYLAKLHAGEVEMLYQPIVELGTGRVYKVEALARLAGDYRLVLPAEFLPAFGDEELIRLFELGLDQSLEALRGWEEEGLDLGISVNLPSVSSRDDRYVALVERALAHHKVEPSRLTLELLETGNVGGRPRWRSQVLDQLRLLGVRLAQDDLGSGYSSLLRLRHFAFDDVKLDQSLIRGEEFDPRGALNFIHPLTSLSHSMGLHVIVEGLENDGLIEAAYMLGADAGQGYGISRPLQARDLPGWARGYRLDIDRDNPGTRLGGLAAHVAWEQRVTAMVAGATAVPRVDVPCPLDGYIERLGDPGGHLAEAHAAVHRVSHDGRGTVEHLRWWRALTKMLGGLYS